MIIDFTSRQPLRPEIIAEQYAAERAAIDVHWSVISNLRAYTSDEARGFELLCLQCIDHHLMLYKTWQDKPRRAACFTRLCMLYEKQGRFEDAIEICKTAINCGVYDDGTKGKMPGRLARLLRKAAEQIPNESVN